MRTRKFNHSDDNHIDAGRHELLEPAMQAQWVVLHGVLRDVLDDYPHCKRNSLKKPTLGFEGKFGTPCLDGNVILLNPFQLNYYEVYNLVYEYYNK